MSQLGRLQWTPGSRKKHSLVSIILLSVSWVVEGGGGVNDIFEVLRDFDYDFS